MLFSFLNWSPKRRNRQIRCLTWGIDEWRWGPQEKCVVVGLYILLKSHSCCCHLQSNFFFELLIMWRMRKLVHACARTDVSCGEWMRHMTSLSIRLLNKFDVTCHWWRQLNFQNHVEVKWVSHTSHLQIEGAYIDFYPCTTFQGSSPAIWWGRKVPQQEFLQPSN